MCGRCGVSWTTFCLVLIIVMVNASSIMDFTDDGVQSTRVVSKPELLGKTIAAEPHLPIVINGDANFSTTATNEGWLGDGSFENPYIIDGLNIDLGGAAGHCISISNTQVNFTISNCNLTNASVDPGAGIYLDNVMNAKIIDNLCHQNTHGVLIEGRGSQNCILINNTCTQNSISGIQITEALNITLSLNNCSGNYHGINAIDSIGLSGHSGEHVIVANICCNNTYGISIGDFNIESIGPVANEVISNNCSDNSEDGIRLITPVISSFINNSCNGNGAAGISFDEMGYQCLLVENTFSENGQSGIHLDGAWNNNFTDNFCCENNLYGIYIESLINGYNNFHWNVFSDNLIGNARDEGNDNIFDYNFWSDYSGIDANEDGFGDTPYTFTGNNDPHPLMYTPTPPKWNETPVDQIIEYGTHFIYDLNVTAQGPILWSINWTVHLTINNQGVVESIGTLSLGTFGVQVIVTNIYNISNSAMFTVKVVLSFDRNPPTWVEVPMDLSFEYGVGVDFKIHALDHSGIDHWTINDTAHFELSATYYELGSTARITNRSVLESMSYGLNISAYDQNENYCSIAVTITILEVPTIIPSTTTPTTSPTPEGVNPTMTFVLGVGIGAAAAIVVVIVFLRKKS